MIRAEHKGSFKSAVSWFDRLKNRAYLQSLDKEIQTGVESLERATPKDSGKTAESWHGGIEYGDEIVAHWDNTNVNDGVNVAVLIQYGHGTGTGGYVEGVDYINPALKPVMDRISEEITKEVNSR